MDKIENRNWTLIDEMSEVHHLCAHHRSNTAKQLVRMKWATIEGWAKKSFLSQIELEVVSNTQEKNELNLVPNI